MKLVSSWLLVLIIAASAAAATDPTTGTNNNENNNYDHGVAMMKWLKEMGGYVHPHVEMLRSNPEDIESPFYGVYASKGDVEKGTLLIDIPQAALIKPSSEVKIGDRVSGVFDGDWYYGHIAQIYKDEVNEEDNPDFYEYDIQYDDGEYQEDRTVEQFDFQLDCSTVNRMAKEIQKGEHSQYSTYMQYMQSQPRGQLPASWSEKGQDLLHEVLGTPVSSATAAAYDDSLDPLPPFMDDLLDAHDYNARCGDKNGAGLTNIDDELNLFHLHNQRGWDEIMVPILDILNHGNGRLLNTYHETVREGDSVRVIASRDIKKGEELYNTYNLCSDCVNRYMYYGTPELFRDYGFIEPFPQRWFFQVKEDGEQEELGFELDSDELTPKGKPVPGSYKFKLLVGEPSDEILLYLQQQLLRLRVLSETILDQQHRDPSIPDNEWNAIVQYEQSLTTAITVALEEYKSIALEVTSTGEAVKEIGETDLSFLYYGSLEDMPEVEYWEDDRPLTCKYSGKTDRDRKPYFDDESKYVQTIKSPYQVIEYFLDLERNDDLCMMLDEVVQICTSYRPIYHEMVVHNTARYLENDVRRVLFVGGGDSMLLHDILKYPTLEKVVGLEIDQYVTRSAWVHFGAEPHFDNEKVEWWYGDATKSLLMLPKEYFGSFDMVLVDLSETVASLSVTTEMTVMEALSLLLQPKGIIVKNEYNYFPEQRNIYRDTKMLHWYKVPWVCSQSLILASNGIDLMRGEYKDRGVEAIYPLLDEPHIKNSYLHDYQKNYSNPLQYCLAGDSYDSNNEQAKQEKSPGIMMLIEAEDSKLKLDSSQKIKSIIEKTMKEQGFDVVDSFVPSNVNPNVVVAVLKEGYVVVRTFPEYKYCAIDFQLWSSYHKQDNARRALIEAVGSKVNGPSSSAYRIVSGGIFGVDSWREDERNRGPKMSRCEESVEEGTSVYDKESREDLVMEAVLEGQGMVLEEEGFLVLVICGSTSNCQAKEKLKELDAVSDVLVLRPCSEIDEGADYTQDTLSQIAKCEVKTCKLLQEAVNASGKKIRSIVLGPSTPHSFAMIVHNIFRGKSNANNFFADNMVVLAPLFNLEETWPITFVDKFRTEIFPKDPSFRAEVYFNSTSDSSFMMSLFSSGDRLFGDHVAELAQRMESRFNVKGEIRSIRGSAFGNFIVHEPSSIDQSINFTDADFFQESQLDHWNAQKPLGEQVLFQFEIDLAVLMEEIPLWRKTKFQKALENTLQLFVYTDVEYKSLSLGEGQLVLAVWKEGSAMLLYDGRAHVDVNLFINRENPSALFEMFERNFWRFVPGATRTLRDAQPRGTGRVVSFLFDMGGFNAMGKPVNYPRWAPP